jgi:hypothetical protein
MDVVLSDRTPQGSSAPIRTEDDDLPVQMSFLEQYFDRNGWLHSVIIPDRDLFAPEP